jgi:hypothetical protein
LFRCALAETLATADAEHHGVARPELIELKRK